MTSNQNYQINIAITITLQTPKHTALYLVPGGGVGGPTYYCHIRGSSGSFAYEPRKDYDPTRTVTSAKIISIGDTTVPVAVEKLLGIMSSVPACNQDPAFSSEVWVDTAAAMMLEGGYLSRNQYEALMDAVASEI